MSTHRRIERGVSEISSVPGIRINRNGGMGKGRLASIVADLLDPYSAGERLQERYRALFLLLNPPRSTYLHGEYPVKGAYCKHYISLVTETGCSLVDHLCWSV